MMTRNDAKLWAAFADQIRESTGFPIDTSEMVARQLVAIVRRHELPGVRTWALGDKLPDPPPAAVYDSDGVVWDHQDAGHGCYAIREFSAAAGPEHAGVHPWLYLLMSRGPLTETQGPD